MGYSQDASLVVYGPPHCVGGDGYTNCDTNWYLTPRAEARVSATYQLFIGFAIAANAKDASHFS